jgi:hypothetical protein
MVSNSTPWILDVKTPSATQGVTGPPDGPFPAGAYATNSGSYQGEIIIWLTNGKVSGLEYAWVTDDRPTRWPRPDEIEVVTELLKRRKPSLLMRIRPSQTVSQMDADDLVSTIGEELVDNLADDWEPTDYGRDVSALLAVCDRNRGTAPRPGRRSPERVDPPRWWRVYATCAGCPIRQPAGRPTGIGNHLAADRSTFEWRSFPPELLRSSHTSRRGVNGAARLR